MIEDAFEEYDFDFAFVGIGEVKVSFFVFFVLSEFLDKRRITFWLYFF